MNPPDSEPTGAVYSDRCSDFFITCPGKSLFFCFSFLHSGKHISFELQWLHFLRWHWSFPPFFVSVLHLLLRKIFLGFDKYIFGKNSLSSFSLFGKGFLCLNLLDSGVLVFLLCCHFLTIFWSSTFLLWFFSFLEISLIFLFN